MITVISLGAGVQSSTMSLMAAAGEIEPMPDCAIFADTGWEPKVVYRHLDWLTEQLPFPVHVVTDGNLREQLVARSAGRAGRFLTVPFFLKHRNDAHGIGRRQCTSHYKVEPIREKIRELLGRPKGPVPAGSAEKWIGISVDEVIRATPSKVRFEIDRFPLLKKRMTRADCLGWLRRHGYPEPPKPSCIGCPFHSDRMWREMRDQRPEEWADAIEIDKLIRRPIDRPGASSLRGEQFMHAQRVPLDQVDLTTYEDRGQLNLFVHECEGLCGV
ncbi:hypothetical protein [Sinorhizobium fredii]|uniref:hypothetical protein n=1 Tax=Rhizobium fredii TaxID=380 RepID=UPI0004B32C48|nr:hypothetical protein [Sinorhizobium fredii]